MFAENSGEHSHYCHEVMYGVVYCEVVDDIWWKTGVTHKLMCNAGVSVAMCCLPYDVCIGDTSRQSAVTSQGRLQNTRFTQHRTVNTLF